MKEDKFRYQNKESTVPVFEIKTIEKKFPREKAEYILSTYSSKSSYADSKWLIDKIDLDQNLSDKLRYIYFGSYSSADMLLEVKDWAIMQLSMRRDNRTITHNISALKKFDDNISSGALSFFRVSNVDVLNLYNHLFKDNPNGLKSRLESWFNVMKFYKEMDCQEVYQTMSRYIVPSFPSKKKVESKLIPDEVIKKMDVIFKTMEIPLAYRTIYWLLRLLPNRIGEVLSMTNMCLKAIDEDTYILTIPTFKQSGLYATGTLKLIEIKNEGIGAYLISLIKQQIHYVNTNPEDNNNFLFRSKVYGLYRNKTTGHKEYRVAKNEIKNISIDSFNRFLKLLSEYKDIRDNKGDLYKVTSHQFRHNAISDRMNSGIFRAIDIKNLTKHQGTAMIEQTYTHTTQKDIKRDSPVVFRGRIINTDNEKKMNQLLIRPYAKRIHNLGVCSDIRNCSKDKSKCLRCEYLVPDVDNLDYYKYELSDWKKKKHAAINNGNVVFADLCQDWIESYDVLIGRIVKALTDEGVEIENGDDIHDN